MGKILDFFRGSSKTEPTACRDVTALVEPFKRKALQLCLTSNSRKSRFGGDPRLPSGKSWPSKEGIPLTFLATIDLEEIGQTGVIPWLPDSGRLVFFYDMENWPWGFDPVDRGGCAVMYIEPSDNEDVSQSIGPCLPMRFIASRVIETLPSWERPSVVALDLNEKESDWLCDACIDVYENESSHQIGGYPNSVQGDSMELECQLVTNGLYCGDATGYEDPRAESLAGGAEDWVLLLQIDSDDELGVMWGDCGILYFWVKEADARAGNFDNAWVILQCS